MFLINSFLGCPVTLQLTRFVSPQLSVLCSTFGIIIAKAFPSWSQGLGQVDLQLLNTFTVDSCPCGMVLQVVILARLSILLKE